MASAIVCDSLTRDFGEVRALDGLTLSVPEGSIFAFLGPNGAGKTTTIHLLLGIIEPTAGSASVLGRDPATDGAAVRRQCGALLEHSGLYERLSAEDNLRFYASIARLDRADADARIADVLTRFGLYERRRDLTGTWSRGMKQQLAIARALLHRPALVFLDEPTAGLDPEATVALRRDIASLGTTVFLTTHNLADVEKMATHVAVIRRGQLLDFGTPSELRARAIRSHVTIRMRDREPLALEVGADESVAPVVTRLVQEGAQIEEVRRDEPTIEDVFLHLVRSAAVPAADAGASRAPARVAARDAATSAGATPALRAVVRKEWRELFAASSRGNVIAGVIMLVIIGALAGFVGEKLITSPAMMSATMIGFVVLLASVADSFAGERERHTLETLLASAIPDEALLFGKIGASVLYGWLLTLALLAVALIGVNVTRPGTMYPISTLLGALLLAPLLLGFFSTAGVLVSMRSQTVRDAQTRLAALFFALFIPFVAVRPFIPSAWRAQAVQMMFTEGGRIQAVAGQIAFFAILDLALLALAVARFKRATLI